MPPTEIADRGSQTFLERRTMKCLAIFRGSPRLIRPVSKIPEPGQDISRLLDCGTVPPFISGACTLLGGPEGAGILPDKLTHTT